MRRFSPILILLVGLAFLPAKPAVAWFFGSSDTLVSIDGTKYSSEDFKRWWKFWNDEDLPLPKTPDPYIDFLLLAREGERMGLDETPDFKRQTRVFLQARTLLMLKYDAVDSQIKISDADLKSHYEERYLPRWLAQRLEFSDEASARAAWGALEAKTSTVEDLLAKGPEEGGPVKVGENWLRPSGIDPGWVALFKKMAVGEVVNPEEHAGGPALYRLKEQKGGDDEDFAGLKEEIRRDFWKLREDQLSAKLLQDLYKKFEVKVDEERLEAIDINAADETFTDAIVISTSEQEISEKQFMAVVRKLMANRPTAAHATRESDEAKKLKAETVNNILAQSLTNWEALDRHYEEKEPFKWEYQFNRAHRLTLALEEMLFLPEAKNVTEADIKKHYEENLERYSQPTVVRLYIADETQGPIDQVWSEVLVGKEFVKAMKAHFQQGVPLQEVPANHLDPDVKAVVDKLTVGETSKIFKAQDIRVMVHLVGRTPASPIPLERVAGTIRSKLVREKVNQERKDYLEELRSRSKIEVRKGQWQAIQKELGGA